MFTRILRSVPVAALIALAGCSSSAVTSPTTTTTAPRSAAPISVFLELAHPRSLRGVPIAGTVIMTNRTPHAITVETCVKNGWLDVGLVNGAISFDPAHTEIGCNPTQSLSPGSTRFPVAIVTTYQSCTQAGGSATPSIPSCSAIITPPPLPAGRYWTKIVISGLDGETQLPAPTLVTLTSPSS